MDNRLFIDSFKGLNSSFLKLLDALSALRELSAIPVHEQSDRQLLDTVLQVLMSNQELERCSVFLMEDGELVNAAGLGWGDLVCNDGSGESCVPITFKPGEGLVGSAAAAGEQIHCGDCNADSRFRERCGSCRPDELTGVEEGRQQIGSLICTPIMGNGEVLGVLNVSHPHAGFFNETHERTLAIFCNVLGQLLLNNRLVQHMNELVNERTQQLQGALEEAEQLKQRYAKLSVIDELTTLYNRRFFFPESRALVSRAQRYHQPFSLLLLDIDHFKTINDSYGHVVGDQVLREVAAVLRGELREGDVLARFGGEEFIIALPNSDLDGARQLSERIREQVKLQRWSEQGREFGVSVCIGVAELNGEWECYGDSEATLDRLVSEADQALYFGKQNGRDQCCVYAEIACHLS